MRNAIEGHSRGLCRVRVRRKVDMKIKELSQVDAGDLLKTLQDRPNFEKAFQVEIDRKKAGELTWALPQDDPDPAKARTYYVVNWDDNEPYLFVGINGYLNVSSVFRVASTSIKSAAVQCFKHLLREKVLPVCRSRGRDSISAYPSTDDGRKFFAEFQLSLPDGVIKSDEIGKIIISVNGTNL